MWKNETISEEESLRQAQGADACKLRRNTAMIQDTWHVQQGK